MPVKNYKVEYWFLNFVGDYDFGYDYERVDVKAISPKQAILKAKEKARKGAKNFAIVDINGKVKEYDS